MRLTIKWLVVGALCANTGLDSPPIKALPASKPSVKRLRNGVILFKYIAMNSSWRKNSMRKLLTPDEPRMNLQRFTDYSRPTLIRREHNLRSLVAQSLYGIELRGLQRGN